MHGFSGSPPDVKHLSSIGALRLLHIKFGWLRSTMPYTMDETVKIRTTLKLYEDSHGFNTDSAAAIDREAEVKRTISISI